jgi:DNA-binding response OmpR family regulator
MLSAMDSQATGVSRCVLLIDDDEQIAGSLRKYLIRRGCETESARERKSAAELLSSRRFDLILLDPYLTGEAADCGSLLTLVRERQALATIVLLTAYLSSELGNQALQAGVRAIITKPKPVRELGEFALGFLASHDLP